VRSPETSQFVGLRRRRSPGLWSSPRFGKQVAFGVKLGFSREPRESLACQFDVCGPKACDLSLLGSDQPGSGRIFEFHSTKHSICRQSS